MSSHGEMGDRIAERRLARMRMGQSTCAIRPLPTDPEMEVAIVPVLEGENQLALDTAASYVAPENSFGFAAREEVYRKTLLTHACRNPKQLDERVWLDADQIDASDVNFLWDEYMELVSEVSPSILGLTTEDFNDLKKALQEMDWSALSGRQWYAAERFLLAISPTPLLASTPGSSSTKPATETTMPKTPTPTVSPS